MKNKKPLGSELTPVIKFTENEKKIKKPYQTIGFNRCQGNNKIQYLSKSQPNQTNNKEVTDSFKFKNRNLCIDQNQ